MPHTIRALGVSNLKLSQLQKLYDAAIVKPSFVQNRFYKRKEVRLRRPSLLRTARHRLPGVLDAAAQPGGLGARVLVSVADGLHVERELAF